MVILRVETKKKEVKMLSIKQREIIISDYFRWCDNNMLDSSLVSNLLTYLHNKKMLNMEQIDDYISKLEEKEKEKEDDKIRVGDFVRVKNWGRAYTKNINWFVKNVSDLSLVAKYSYNNHSNFDFFGVSEDDKRIFRVFVIADNKACISIGADDECYLIGLDALVKVKENEDE